MTREEKKEVLEAFERFPDDVKLAFAVGRAFAEIERETEKSAYERTKMAERENRH